MGNLTKRNILFLSSPFFLVIVGTLAEEDESYELLKFNSILLPFINIVSGISDALFVAAYLRIVGQKVKNVNILLNPSSLKYFRRLI